MPAKKISIFTILKIGNLVFGGVFVWLFLAGIVSSFINETTYFYALLLVVSNSLLISDSKKNENPLLILLSLWLILFVELRIVTLALTDFSFVLSRFDAKPNDVNFSLLIIIICVICLWLPLHISKSKINNNVRGTDYCAPRNISRALFFWFVTFILQLAASMGIPVVSGLSEIISQYFLNVSLATLIVGVYCIHFWRYASKSQHILFILMLLSYILWQTLQGNRSGIFAILTMVIVAALAMKQYSFRRVYIIGAGILAPIMLLFFSFATILRQLDVGNEGVNNVDISGIIMKSRTDVFSAELLNPVFDRIGYLDYACEMITQRNKFNEFINISNEIKSIVDNALSPGFDVFDAPKISNTITNYYIYGVITSKKAITNLDYHSDELTLFGETSVLFGIPLMFIVLLICGFVFRRLWLENRKGSSIINGIIKHAIYLFQYIVIELWF